MHLIIVSIIHSLTDYSNSSGHDLYSSIYIKRSHFLLLGSALRTRLPNWFAWFDYRLIIQVPLCKWAHVFLYAPMKYFTNFVGRLQISPRIHSEMNRIKIFKTISDDVMNVIEIHCTPDVLAGDPNKPVQHSVTREHKLFINWVQREWSFIESLWLPFDSTFSFI